MRHTVVQLTTHNQDGDTMHRRTWPMQALAALPEFRVIDVHFLSPYSYQLALDADLLILPMILNTELVPLVRCRKARGRPTVFEASNCPFDMHPLSPMFDLWTNPLTQMDFLHLLSIADLVQVSSPALADAFRPYCASSIVVFLNQLADAPSAMPEKTPHPLILGWAGTLSHVADVAHIARALSTWVMDHDSVKLHVMSDAQMERLFPLPPEKKQWFPFGGMDAYEQFLKGVHIALGPLQDTPFNRGRSDVKWLECSAQGCVFVGQRLVTYTGSVDDGKTGFLFGDTAELLRILDRLHEDRGLLQAVARAAFEHVTRKRRYADDVRERAKVYRELLDRKPSPVADTSGLGELCRFPRPQFPDPAPDYLPIRLDAEEHSALKELYSHRTHISGSGVKLLEDRYGEFHLTCYGRALIAGAKNDIAGAEQQLRRSLSFYPAAIASVQLLTQFLLRSKRVDLARQILTRTSQCHPAYVPIYRHLIALAAQRSDWTEAIALTNQWEKNCHDDPKAALHRGLILIRAGQKQEGMNLLSDAMTRLRTKCEHWYPPFASEVPAILREAEPLVADHPNWPDVVLKASELFPHGLWLPARAGVLCSEKGDYARGLELLQQAHRDLLNLEWLKTEGTQLPPEYRQQVAFYLMACDGFSR